MKALNIKSMDELIQLAKELKAAAFNSPDGVCPIEMCPKEYFMKRMDEVLQGNNKNKIVINFQDKLISINLTYEDSYPRRYHLSFVELIKDGVDELDNETAQAIKIAFFGDRNITKMSGMMLKHTTHIICPLDKSLFPN